jgi:hypothetical protein
VLLDALLVTTEELLELIVGSLEVDDDPLEVLEELLDVVDGIVSLEVLDELLDETDDALEVVDDGLELVEEAVELEVAKLEVLEESLDVLDELLAVEELLDKTDEDDGVSVLVDDVLALDDELSVLVDDTVLEMVLLDRLLDSEEEVAELETVEELKDEEGVMTGQEVPVVKVVVIVVNAVDVVGYIVFSVGICQSEEYATYRSNISGRSRSDVYTSTNRGIPRGDGACLSSICGLGTEDGCRRPASWNGLTCFKYSEPVLFR